MEELDLPWCPIAAPEKIAGSHLYIPLRAASFEWTRIKNRLKSIRTPGIFTTEIAPRGLTLPQRRRESEKLFAK
jgi:hypothetical protein